VRSVFWDFIVGWSTLDIQGDDNIPAPEKP
jgi:hypothetical protein